MAKYSVTATVESERQFYLKDLAVNVGFWWQFCRITEWGLLSCVPYSSTYSEQSTMHCSCIRRGVFANEMGCGHGIRSRAPKTIRCRFMCRRANVNTTQKPCAKCINDKWHITLKQKQFQVCVFVLGMQKNWRRRKESKRECGSVFSPETSCLSAHTNTNTYGHAQWFTIISGASSMKRSATVQERRQGVVLRSVNIASVYSSQLIWWTLITLLC